MKTSEQINEIAKALAQFQSKMSGAEKDSQNPFFKSKYASLESTILAIKPAHDLGISFTQGGNFNETMGWHICTRIFHNSGQWIEAYHPIVVSKQNDPQSFGSAESYAKRYALKSIFGIPDQDDDAEAAVSRGTTLANEIRNTTTIGKVVDPKKCSHTWYKSKYKENEEYCSKCKTKRAMTIGQVNPEADQDLGNIPF